MVRTGRTCLAREVTTPSEDEAVESTAPKLRPAARGVVLDRDDRILLVRFEFDDGTGLWATPGGGVEPGESLQEALVRELREEIGLEPPADPPHLWHQEVVAEGHATGYDGVINDYFLVRVDTHHPAGTLTAAELQAEHVHDIRWWTLSELESHRGNFAPRALPQLIQSLLTDGPPSEPLQLGL